MAYSPSSSISSLDMDLQSDNNPSIPWSVSGHTPDWSPSNTAFHAAENPAPAVRSLPYVDPSSLPDGSRSLSGISLRSFLLGLVLGTTTLISLCLVIIFQHPLWRVPFFLACLSLFHFLEYYITATYNTPYASISAFLLSQNGSAYNIAHSAAMLECLISRRFLPDSYFDLSSYLFGGPVFAERYLIPLGLIMVVVGQVTRTLAMITAAGNFTHTVQIRRRKGHHLVTGGIYAWLRHPSYFGFFWWGLGTQVMLGNRICLLGYAFVLWKFFKSRIRKEEELLVRFFGNDYISYRNSTYVGIPGIQ